MAGRGKAKKKSRNAYWYFVEEYRQKNNIGSWEQANKLTDELWQKLNPSQKQKYVDMAKAGKNSGVKLTNTGVPISSVIEGHNDLQRAEMEEMTNIKRIVDDDVILTERKEFFIIHTNYYCINENRQYSICEVAVCYFSLLEGVISYYHGLVDTKIPLGYGHIAQCKSAEIGIDMPPLKGAQQDYKRIFAELKGFFETAVIAKSMSDDEFPPLYTMPEEIESTKDFIKQICYAAVEENNFKIYQLPTLFYELTKKIKPPGLVRSSLAYSELKRDTHTYAEGISCKMHQPLDQFPKCSLSIVKRWCFTICDYCCKLLNIEPIPGLHIPHSFITQLNEYVTNTGSIAGSSRYPDSTRSQSPTNDDGFTPVRSRSRKKF